MHFLFVFFVLFVFIVTSCTIFPVPRPILRAGIIVFCLFHMTAVASYSVSENWEIAPVTFIRKHTVRYVRPYLLSTSQWQQWNLFSPDPLRRVSRYRVQVFQENEWQESAWLDEGLSYHRKANITKTLRRLEEQGTNAKGFLRFLSIACNERGLPAGTQVRLERMYQVLPKPQKPLSLSQWRAYEPQWTTDTLAERPCTGPV